MRPEFIQENRQDCLIACSGNPDVKAALKGRRIAVTGGTGFLGSWIAEMVAALNDENSLGIKLDLYARNITDWVNKYPHLSARADISVRVQDVRSPFELERDTSYIIHAAGVPDNRVISSDPMRVMQTTIGGIENTLEAATKLTGLIRFLNVSSALVSGRPSKPGPITEDEYFPMACGVLHSVYAEAKRSAESLAAAYRSQFRLPVSTIRPFTLTGPYQTVDRPWALNNFMRDILTGSEIRIHGDGRARRSYMYGSDSAWWTLVAMVKGADGATYNLGSAEPISHSELAKKVSEKSSSRPGVIFNTVYTKPEQLNDLYPDLSRVEKALGVRLTCSLDAAIDKTWRWFLTN